MCSFFGDPKFFCRTVACTIGRREILPSWPFPSLWARNSQLSRVQRFVSPNLPVEFQWIFMQEVFLHFLCPHLICLCDPFRGDWLFGEWPNWEFSADPLNAFTRQIQVFSHSWLWAFSWADSKWNYCCCGNCWKWWKCPLWDYTNYDWWIWVFSLL